MKKFFLTMMFAVAAMAGMAQTIGEAFYIYRNDGQFNAFFRDEVDSIAYSNFDADSVFYDEVVMQVVYTADSIYRIPLASVDSVAFVQPETVYQPGVKVIEGEMRANIIGCEGLTLLFSGTTSDAVLPNIGDLLVSTTGDEKLDRAFIGRVKQILAGNSITVVCEPAALTDAFETYYGCVRSTNKSKSKIKRRSPEDGVYQGDTIFSPGKQSIDIINTHNTSVSYNKDDQMSFGIDNAHLTLSVTPVVRFNAFTIINRQEIYTQVSIFGDYTVEEELEMSGNFTFNTDFPFFKPKPIPVPEALLDITFEAGVFGKGQANVSIEQHWTQQLKSTFVWNWSNRGNATLKNTKDLRLVSNTHTGKVAVNGNVGVGIYVQPGVAFIATSDLDIAEAGLRAEWGISLEGTYVPYKRDEQAAKTSTDLYNQIKDREIAVYGYRGLAVQAKLFAWSVSHEIPNDVLPIPFNKKEPWGSLLSVPNFAETKLSITEDNDYFATTKVSGDVQSLDIGMALINKDDKNDAIYSYSLSDYKGPKAEIYSTFTNISTDKHYVAYPLVNYMGMDMIAEPKGELQSCPDSNHPHWIDLGLPSGTKWACCNVGARAPVDYGNYYAWGETQPKSVYNWSTYQYYNGNMSYPDCYIYIGSDIAGTSYDAATANWGAPWRMPSLTQIQELLNYTTSTWTTENGVNGQKFTGSNGGSIFFPAAGIRWSSGLNEAGLYGHYWSSTLYLDFAYHLYFSSANAHWGSYSSQTRSYGQSVRPVR